MGSNLQQQEVQPTSSVTEIDRSCRWPVLYLFAAAIGWLAISLVFGLVSSVKMHAPGFLASCPYVGFGRVRPVFLDAAIYGFASQAALGASLWMLARLGRTPLVLPGVAALGGVVWNAGVTVGLLQILFGQSTGLAWMEFPRQAAALLAGGFFLIAVSAFYTLHERRVRDLFVSHWFIIAGLFVFPWLLTAAYFLGVIEPLRGVMQPLVAAWFSNGVQWLWLTPVTLAVAYYLLPKIAGRPVHSNQAAALGFWVMVVFGSWSGPAQLAGGPFPRWILSTGVAAKFVLFVAAAAFGMNWFLTRAGTAKGGGRFTAAPFVSFGAVAFLAASLLEALQGIPEVSRVTGLTTFGFGVTFLWLFGFVAMVLVGAVYHISERLLDCQWASSGMIKLHLVLSGLGVVLVSSGSLLGGVRFGSSLSDATVLFGSAAKGLVPFLGIGSLGITLLLLGQLILAVNFLRTVVRGTEGARAEFCAWCCGCGTSGDAKKARARA